MQLSWTPERTDALRERWARGESSGAIAHALGTTRSAVMGKVMRLRLPPHTREHAAKNQQVVPKHKAAKPPGHKTPKPSEPPRLRVPPRGTPLFKLLPHHCRWPLGDSPFKFCGAVRATPWPYCAKHCRLAYRPSHARG